MQKKRVQEESFSKIRVIFIALILIVIAVVGKIIWIQYGSPSSTLRARAVESNFKNEVLEAKRGDILSHEGLILTTSVPYYEIRMDMLAEGLNDEYFNANVGALADSLSRFFKDKSPAQYKQDIVNARKKGNRYYRINIRKVNFLDLQRIARFPIFDRGQHRGGFIASGTERRVKPFGKLASRTIGFMNEDGVKVGIEGGFDEYLRGTDGVTMMQKISGSFWIPVASDSNIEPINGYDIITSIDVSLQNFVQQELEERLWDTEADWGTVVVMETATGEVRAIANGTRLQNGQIVEDYNYAVGMSMEPGSTFKMAVLMTLLDDAKASLNEVYSTGSGREKIGYATVVDVGSYGSLSLLEGFEKSSNIVMAKAVNKYYGHNPERFVNALYKLGLNKPLGLPIFGEAQPQIKHPRDKQKGGWDGMTLTMMSYGYALRLTALQTLTLCNAIANGGVMVKPKLVKGMLHFGDTVEMYPTEIINPQICSPNTVKLMQRAMEGVVTAGTARSLQSSLYRAAAKTGTAQIAMGRGGYEGYGGKHYLGTVVGYFPAENPKYSIIVSMKTFRPHGSSKIYYGGSLTTPVFKSIAEHLVVSEEQFASRVVQGTTVLDSTLYIKGSDNETLHHLLNQMKVVSNRNQLGNYRNLKIQANSNGNRDSVAQAQRLDVIGYTFSEALNKLEREGYRVNAKGRGVVVSQTVDTSGVVTIILK